MCLRWSVFLLLLFDSEFISSTHGFRLHGAHWPKVRRHRATNDGGLRFEPQPYSKKLELYSSGKIHCKVAGGTSPTVQWFLNENEPLPEGITSANGTLHVTSAERRHAASYTCRASEGDKEIVAHVTLDVVVSPRIIEPLQDQQKHVSAGQPVYLDCKADGEPLPTTHWDRNLTVLQKQQDEIEVEDGPNVATARIILYNNGTLYIKNATEKDTDRYGCTAGSAAGLSRAELMLIVHPEGEPLPQESTGVAGKAVVISISVAGAYMILVLALMLYCRRRRLRRRQRGDKMELEMTEGREKLVEEGEEDKKKVNGSSMQNGRLLPLEKDSGADNSEVSAISRVSKKSGQYDHLAVPRSLLTDKVTLGRGEFGDVILAKIDVCQIKKLRNKGFEGAPRIKSVLVKELTTKDENQLMEFRRQLDMFSRVRHENIARLFGVCLDGDPHCMLLEATEWGDLKSFLQSAPLPRAHGASLQAQLAGALCALHAARVTHRDIATRNCFITPKLELKLSLAALARGPDSRHYYKHHDQVIPLRWLPAEAVLEGDYSAKSDVYMYAATVWEIYNKAEIPFPKLNDNSVLERLKAGTLEWTLPDNVPERLANLLRRCWSKSPTDRPQAEEISAETVAILKEITAEESKKQEEKIEG